MVLGIVHYCFFQLDRSPLLVRLRLVLTVPISDKGENGHLERLVGGGFAMGLSVEAVLIGLSSKAHQL